VYVCVHYCSTCIGQTKKKPSPHANSFIIGTAVINTHTHVLNLFYLCRKFCLVFSGQAPYRAISELRAPKGGRRAADIEQPPVFLTKIPRRPVCVERLFIHGPRDRVLPKFHHHHDHRPTVFPLALLLSPLPPPSIGSQCVFITAVLITKLFAWGGNNGGHVLRETTSRGLCGLVCPSRTSERGGEGYCVKEGGGEEGERERERALGRLLCHSHQH